MSGYVLAWSPCIACGRVFSYNPHRVPSSSAVTGQREPICQPCMHRLNAKRKEMGLEPFQIHQDAYEPLPEEQL